MGKSFCFFLQKEALSCLPSGQASVARLWLADFMEQTGTAHSTKNCHAHYGNWLTITVASWPDFG